MTHTRPAACVLVLLLGAGCGSGASTPPTYVLAWIAPGGQVRTLESADARAWRRSSVDPHATTVSRDRGPAVAHDGNLTWMLMWVAGPELQYKVGVGGLAGTSGINWEQSPTVGKLVVNSIDSPALAYGNGRWVVVLRRAGDQLHVVRSAANSATSWEPPIDVIHQDVTARPAMATRAPALVFGTFDGQPLFVLVYVNGTRAFAATSADGLSWSPPTAVGGCEKDPALTARNGRLFALLSRQVSFTGAASSFHAFVLKSCDAVNWTEVGSYPGSANNATGPGMAYGGCTLAVTEQIGGALGGTFTGISARTATLSGSCDDPPAFSIGADQPVQVGLATVPPSNETVGSSAARTALAFGEARGTSAPPPCEAMSRRRLLITEWFPEFVELYLDEPASITVDLAEVFLDVIAKVDLQPNVDEPDYGNRTQLAGTMAGGSFLIVFEEFGYTGPPVRASFVDPVGGHQLDGIKVSEGFFGWNKGGASTSLRISGLPGGFVVDDVLLIGGRPRPAIGGRFLEDTPAFVALPIPPETLGRKWHSAAPIDNDLESDWEAGPRTLGERTP